MQIKVQNRKLKNLGKTCRKFFFLTLFSIILVFGAKTNMFSTNSFKICYSFAKNKIFENSKMAAKMVDMLWKRLLLWQQFLIKTWILLWKVKS